MSTLSRVALVALFAVPTVLASLSCGNDPTAEDFRRVQWSGEVGPPAAHPDAGFTPNTYLDLVLEDGTYKYRRLGEPEDTLTVVKLDTGTLQTVKSFLARDYVVRFLRDELPDCTKPADTWNALEVSYAGESHSGYLSCGSVGNEFDDLLKQVRAAAP